MLREPSVSWLPYFGSSPSVVTIFTFDQSASISSATTIGKLVETPVPISARCDMIVTMPSLSMAMNTFGLLTVLFGMPSPPVGYGLTISRADAGEKSIARMRPVVVSKPPMTLRRLTFSIETRRFLSRWPRNSCSM